MTFSSVPDYGVQKTSIFLNEPLINTSVFDSTKNNLLNVNVETGNEAVDNFFKGNIELINNFLMALAEEQIKTAFEQCKASWSEKTQEYKFSNKALMLFECKNV